MTDRPLVSAAIIAKDEERFIGDCLASLRGIADEIVVVDTGSTDATVEMARAAGARLGWYPWTGDFSAARNHALDLATGEWILYIDCDERVVASDAEKTAARARMAASDGTVAFRLLFATLSGNTPYREYRLWRHRPDIRFRGVIHETMVPAIGRISRTEGLAIEPIDLLVEHLGYEGDQHHKHERNLPLLLAQIDHDPRRVYLRWHLGVVLAGLGRFEEALDAWWAGVAIVREDGWKSQTDLLAYCELAYRLGARGDDVADLIAEGLAFDPGCHTLTIAALWTALREERADDVERLAAQLLDAGRRGVVSETLSYPKVFFTVMPWKAIAESRWDRGDAAGAAEAFEELLRHEPGDLEYRAKAAAARAAARLATR